MSQKASTIMGSRKRSAWAKETAEFKANLGGGMDDIFAREEQRNARRSQEKDAALRKKACESKNRYATRYEALDAIASCADHGTTGLQCYHCPHCNGWHLTSHPRNE